MKKSKRKIREATESEFTYKVVYISNVDKLTYWTLIHARNELEVSDLFENEFYTNESEILTIEKQ